ncbi:bifunctional transcriptional activator/DNA repair enzyme AdaA [Arsenicibacter rosenii]|uniref:methylated-DNA--[protein]-cysteine S-methyltransferase n=1 Tax=Arsenicibacter rosenii TaxID=1750698 RepID=A0A1S2VAQ8_9BACT|nr:methylated-DNA--[protein]-cysteine S-methyltransferase [Arsenicibacter rosenii]OIN55827.1 cysteine methyltransferase [Arsenicibacter rosenii]
MNTYQRIEKAINYLQTHFREQPDLEQIAEQAHLSAFHFQRLFTEWAGVSPKKFVQFLSVNYAKELLLNQRLSVSETAYETGLSGTSRLHDLFVSIEAMTPAEYRDGGQALRIRYQFADTLFGRVVVAATEKGVCTLQFIDDDQAGMVLLRQLWPNAVLLPGTDAMQEQALLRLTENLQQPAPLALHLKGTPFQLKVWEALLQIPEGKVAVYGDIAQLATAPAAVRAVGTAIGDNPVAYLIPCHRVLRKSGELGGYHWGTTRKLSMLFRESVSFDYQCSNR